MNNYMQAMILDKPKLPLKWQQIVIPEIKDNEVLIKVTACGVCRTDLHIRDAELKNPKLPLILGHEIVGVIEKTGSKIKELQKGEKVGIPWLAETCKTCAYCICNKENLCDQAIFTGYTKDGGYASHIIAHADYCFSLDKLNKKFNDQELAPLLCAGLIGWRAYKFTHDAKTIGIYGFGAAAHIITQIAKFQNKEIYAFTKTNDIEKQNFAKSLGAIWAGNSNQSPPIPLDAAIIFAPDGDLIPQALRSIKKGGILVLAGIHMSDIPSFPYDILWNEKQICSVANLTRADGKEFFTLLETCPLQTHIKTYNLKDANQALNDLKEGSFQGAAILVPNDDN
jgi:propanol-preferring alcohol dehydrogenase